jgi:hypothetical protein
MVVEVTPLTVPLLVVAVVGAGLAVLSLNYRGQKGAYPLAGVFSGAALWAGAYALELSSTAVDPALLWLRLRFVGSTVVPVAIFVLALELTDRDDLTLQYVLALFALPSFTAVAIWRNPAGIWAARYVFDPGAVPSVTADWGPWFVVYVSYQFTLAVGAIFLFARRAVDREGARSNTASLLLVATVLPAVGTGLYVAGVSGIDYGAFAFLPAGLLMLVAMFYL